MSIILIRTIILYITVNIAFRIMGKRQIGELQPAEFIVALLISEIAAAPILDTELPIMSVIIPIISLIAIEVLLSFITLKSCNVREVLSGKPSVIIHKGVIDQKEMERVRFNMDDLMKELRIQKILYLEDVYYAIMETNGQLSVFPYKDKGAVTREDLDINLKEELIPYIIISGGKLNLENLKKIRRDENWLKKHMQKQRIERIEEILYFSATEDDRVCIVKKDAKGESK